MLAAKSLSGRDAELALAAKRLDDTAAGRGGVLLITGEPGIGKSALAAAILEEASARGFSVSSGRALDVSGAPPWLPLSACLRSIGISRALLPVDAQEVYGLWEDVLAAQSAAAERAPLLWVLEDLHTADTQTLDLLVFLAQPLRALRALVVITTRALDPSLAPTTAERMSRLARAGDMLALDRLDDAAITHLVQHAAPRNLPQPRIAELVAHAKGHPLFAIELARAGGKSRTSLPATIMQVVQERLAVLPAATRTVLEHAAVFGLEFSAGSVGRLIDRLPAAVIDDLAPALRAGLLEEHDPGRFRFSHALVRDAIHDARPPVARRKAHARAEQLLAEHADTLERLTLRAAHALEAHDAIEPSRAADVISHAVTALAADGAHDRAFTLYRMWLDSLTAAPDPRVLLRAAQLAANAGVFTECTRLANEALARGQSAGDASLTGEAALVLGTNLRPAIVDRQLVRALEDALARLSRDATADPRLRCRVRARLSAALQPAMEPAVPVAMAREAIAEARAIGDSELIRNALFVAGSALTSCVPARETYDVASELAELARAAGDAPLTLRAEVRRLMHALELGQLDVFGKPFDELMLLADSVGLPAHRWRPLIVNSMRALARGHFRESERLLDEVDEQLALTDDPALRFSLQAHSSMRAIAIEDEPGMHEARAAYVRVLAQTPPQNTVRAQLMGFVAVRLADRDAAARELDELVANVDTPLDMFMPLAAAEVAAFVGSEQDCRKVLTSLEPARKVWAVSSQIDFFLAGPIERVLGLLETAIGEHDRAIASLSSAHDECARHGLRPWLARIGFELARAQLAAGRHDEACVSLTAALEHADALPLPLTAKRIREELQKLQTPARPSAAASPAPSASLTLERRGDVWRASYAGREVLLKDSRGVQLLARLISAPGQRVHVLALASDEGSALTESSAGAALDAKSLAQYRARLAQLDEDLATAERTDDDASAARIESEREAITAELKRAVGLGGRLRKVGSTTERARVNVTRRLKDAIAKVQEAHPDLGRYLSDAIRTGTYCSFRP